MATLKVVIIEPDDTVRITEIENDLKSYQEVVGGYIEAVTGRVATMYVNEEGLLRHLPPNPLATLFAEAILGRLGIVLFGTALIVGPPDEEGMDTPVRQSVVDYYTQEN